ncbi:hypothetical protein [Aureimonas sp. AU12]|uniref:hypothetical protein n=1 Tax=Aureimonas sp. AU12 TaxID=1638161 RepID=UPI000781EE36|nr:hypothetical protein [Aureimonas sp. AU12]
MSSSAHETAAPRSAPQPAGAALTRWRAIARHALSFAIGRHRRIHRLDETTPDHVLRDVGLLDGRSRPHAGEGGPFG